MDIWAELQRIFLGSGMDAWHIGEIIFRTVFMYMYTILNVRLMDKRSMGMLTPFEIIIIIALGTAVGDPMCYRDIPMIYGMLVITSIVVTERFLTKLSVKSPFFDDVINGIPVMIIEDGKLLYPEMRKQNITKDELYSMLRLRGVARIAEVQYAYLEPSGSISIIKKDGPLPSDFIPEEDGQ